MRQVPLMPEVPLHKSVETKNRRWRLNQVHAHAAHRTRTDKFRTPSISMSLATGFIASLLTKPKNRIYHAKQRGYETPCLQITSFHENPLITAMKQDGLPVELVNGSQWMTLSDGQHSISAVLFSDLRPLVDSGCVIENSVIDLLAYQIDDNHSEAPEGRMVKLFVDAFAIFRTDFPGRIGEPKDVFDVGGEAPNAPPTTVPELLLTPRSIEVIESGKSGRIFTVPNRMRLQVTSITKLTNDVWHLTVFDGEKSCKADMHRNVEFEEYCLQGLLKNNLSAIMTDTENGLKVNDVISIPQFGIVGEGEAKSMVLHNLTIVHRA
jgi:hypothetical protein